MKIEYLGCAEVIFVYGADEQICKKLQKELKNVAIVEFWDDQLVAVIEIEKHSAHWLKREQLSIWVHGVVRKG